MSAARPGLGSSESAQLRLVAHLFCWGSWLFVVKAGVGLWWDAPAAAVVAAAIAFASSAVFFVPAGVLGWLATPPPPASPATSTAAVGPGPAGSDPLNTGNTGNLVNTPGNTVERADDQRAERGSGDGDRKDGDGSVMRLEVGSSSSALFATQPVPDAHDRLRALSVLAGCVLFAACNLTGLVNAVVPIGRALALVFFWAVEILGSCSFVAAGVLALRDARVYVLRRCTSGRLAILWNLSGSVGFLIVGLLGVSAELATDAGTAAAAALWLAIRASTFAASAAFAIGGSFRLAETRGGG